MVVQHLDPSHPSMLTEIIAKITAMPVEEVKSGTRIKPDCVYVIPHNAPHRNCGRHVYPGPARQGARPHLAVNFFMRSLAAELSNRAIGVILSGTGADGTLGLEDIKAEGGITFAESPASAKYDGMPRSAIESGCVDFVLPPKDIAKELYRIRRHPYVSRDRERHPRLSLPSRKKTSPESSTNCEGRAGLISAITGPIPFIVVRCDAW